MDKQDPRRLVIGGHDDANRPINCWLKWMVLNLTARHYHGGPPSPGDPDAASFARRLTAPRWSTARYSARGDSQSPRAPSKSPKCRRRHVASLTLALPALTWPIVNEAALMAARRNKDAVSREESTRPSNAPRGRTQEPHYALMKAVAYHEAGHALVAVALPNTDPVHKISIFRAASARSATS